MKRIKFFLVLVITFKSVLSFSQNRLSGTFQYNSNSGVGNHYTEVNWQFKYNLAIESGWVVINAYDIDIRPSATSMYRYNGKNLTRGQYGSRSPILEPCGVNIEVNVSYIGKNYRTFLNFNCDGTIDRKGYDEYSLRGSGLIVRVKDVNSGSVDANNFSVTNSKMIGFNQKADNSLDKELYQFELNEYNKSKNNNTTEKISNTNSNYNSNILKQPPAMDAYDIIGEVAITAGEWLSSRNPQMTDSELQMAVEQEKAKANAAEYKYRKELELREYRANLLRKPKVGNVPLFADDMPMNELYYFAYRFDTLTINEQKPTVYLTNVFPIGKYGDGTWPYRPIIKGKLYDIGGDGYLSLMGYYETIEKAEQIRKLFIEHMQQANINVSDLQFEGKKAASIFLADNSWRNDVMIKFNEAEELFEKAWFLPSINKLAEVQSLIEKEDPKVDYLRIKAQEQLVKSSGGRRLEILADLRRGTNDYLNKYAASKHLVDKYKEVYEIKEGVKQYEVNEELFEKATKGDVQSMFLAGEAYYKISYFDKSVEWYEKAAEKGHINSMFMLGEAFHFGHGKKIDYSKAMEWYNKAEEKNEYRAIHNKGLMYYYGIGVSKDMTTGTSLIQKSLPELIKLAKEGDVISAYLLGNVYYHGTAVGVDYDLTLKFLTQAADKKHLESLSLLGVLYYQGEAIKKNDVKSFQLLKTAAELGDENAMQLVGAFYSEGVGVNRDYKESLFWSQKAADRGNEHAMLLTAAIYYEGIDGVKDYKRAIKYFNMAAAKDNALSMNQLGVIYEKAEGVDKDIAKSLEWYRKAAAKNHHDALFNVGRFYYYGIAVQQNYNEALIWLLKAADMNHKESMNYIAYMYEQGLGVKKDKKVGKAWREKAIAIN